MGPFQIGKYEVSQKEFERTMGRNPSYRVNDSLPVERVTWEEAETFCNEMGGRLPTEAEWEYAARAGSASQYYWGAANPSDYAWFRDNSDDHTQKVGLKKPNNWGLYDVSGNVFEWVQDWFGNYPPGTDHPRGAETGTAKVIRGASWYSEGGNLGLGTRYSNRPAFRNFKVGFRCAKEAEPVAEAPGRGAAVTPASSAVQRHTRPPCRPSCRPSSPDPDPGAARPGPGDFRHALVPALRRSFRGRRHAVPEFPDPLIPGPGTPVRPFPRRRGSGEVTESLVIRIASTRRKWPYWCRSGI